MAPPRTTPAAKITNAEGPSLAWTVPQSYTWAEAGLSYERKAAIGTWTPLEPVPGKEGDPISLMVDGDIVISQANEEATCTCRFHKEVGFSYVRGSHAGEEDVTTSVAVLTDPEFSFGGQQPELAKQFPLAKALVSVNGLQLKIPPGNEFKSTGRRGRIDCKTPKQMAEHLREILTRRETLDGRIPPHLLNKAKFSLPELPQPEPSAAEKLADWEGRAAMTMYENEEEVATRLDAFEQDLARRREALEAELKALEAELKAFEQDVPRQREALKARLDAEKRELEESLEMEKLELEEEIQLQACYLLKQYGEY